MNLIDASGGAGAELLRESRRQLRGFELFAPARDGPGVRTVMGEQNGLGGDARICDGVAATLSVRIE